MGGAHHFQINDNCSNHIESYFQINDNYSNHIESHRLLFSTELSVKESYKESQLF